MKNVHIILITILVFSVIFNYLSFSTKKTAVQFVNDIGMGYNLGNTYNCCNIIEEKNIKNEEIKLFGTTLPTKNIIKEIKKNGFKTIRFQILYTNYTFNNNKINSEWIYKIKELINLINQLNMYIILSIKHTRQFWNFEGRNSKDKYINFWSQIANELINYDDHLIFESMYEIGYLIFLDSINNYYEDKDYYLSQYFIDIIRNSGGFNIERLLIIPMISTDYEISLLEYEILEYKIPNDPYNKLAISVYYYFPCEGYSLFNILEPIDIYDILGYSDLIFPLMKWGSIQDYKDIVNNFDNLKKQFIDQGIPVIFGEVGIPNYIIKKNYSLEQFLYTLFSLSFEYKGILPCLWDIPVASSNYKNFYFYLNKENKEWSDDNYGKIFNKISKGKFIKSLDYYYQTNLEIESSFVNGIYNINIDSKRIIKISINISFKKHFKNEIIMTIYSYNKDYRNLYFDFKEKDGKRQYDGTTIFTFDGSKVNLYFYAQVSTWYGEKYLILNNITVQYEETYQNFDYFSYKSDILNDINN